MQTFKNPRGYWKFDDGRVSLPEITGFAEELAQDPRFLSVYIRKVSKNQHGIGFIADVDTSTQEAFAAFNDEISDKIRRKFGNGLVGWDIGSSYTVIK